MLQLELVAAHTTDAAKRAVGEYFQPLSRLVERLSRPPSRPSDVVVSRGPAALANTLLRSMLPIVGAASLLSAGIVSSSPLSHLLSGGGIALLTAGIWHWMFERAWSWQLAAHLAETMASPLGLASQQYLLTSGATSLQPSRSIALRAFAAAVSQERTEVRIMCLSLAGLMNDESRELAIELKRKIRESVPVKVLLAHPAVADLRSSQESRSPWATGREVLQSLKMLLEWKVPSADVRLYKGLPTSFAIITSNELVVSFYATASNSFESPTLIVRRGLPGSIYEACAADFERAWNSEGSDRFVDLWSEIRQLQERLGEYESGVKKLLGGSRSSD